MSGQQRVEVDPVDVVERPVDSKGRISVGTDYAGETVRAAVLDVVDDRDRWADEIPDRCEECGDDLDVWTVVDGEVLCPECAGIESDGEQETAHRSLWFCQFCDTTIESAEQPDHCPECGVEGSGLDAVEVVDADE